MLLKCNPRNATGKNRNVFCLATTATFALLQALSESKWAYSEEGGHTFRILHVPGATIDVPLGRPCLCLA